MNRLIRVMQKIAKNKAKEEGISESAMFKKVQKGTMQLVRHFGEYKTINTLKKKYPYLKGIK